MKNLKKVLSLALAFAMVLGLCVTGMAAQDVTTLPDWDSVTNKDAAMLLNAFEIMQGDENGFRPLDDVKRSEAAKMISVALWGGVDNASLYAAGNAGAYVDVVGGAWYMGYVNYLTVTGVMTGKLEGKFDPDGNVTGYELLKMCLVALGYDAEVEKLTGAGWDLRTMALATQRSANVNLTAGTDVVAWDLPLNRMNTAIIIANMIWRNTVIYDDGKVVPQGSFATEVLGMTPVTGKLVANEYSSIVSETIETDVRGYAGQNTLITLPGASQPYSIEMDSTLYDVGMPVSVFVVGTSIHSVTLAPVTEVEPTFNRDGELTNDEEDKNGDSAVVYYHNDTPAQNLDNIGAVVNGKLVQKSDVEAKWFDTNGNGYIDTVKSYSFTAEKTLKTVTDDEGNVYYDLDKSGKVSNADRKVTSYGFGEAAETWVAMGEDLTTVFGGKYNHGYVLDEVEGKVTRYVESSKKAYIDGIEYTDNSGDAKFGVEGAFYLWADGTIADYEGETKAAVDPVYAVVYDTGYDQVGSNTGLASTASVLLEVVAILEDGTVDTFKVASITTTDGEFVMKGQTDVDELVAKDEVTEKTAEELLTAVTGMVEYTLNEDGTINLVDNVSFENTNATFEVTTGSAKVDDNLYLTKDTITFVQTDDTAGAEKWAVVKGLGLTAGEYTTVSILTDEYLTAGNSKITYAVVPENGAPTEAATEATFLYVISNLGQVGYDGGAIYEVVLYNADTNKIETVQTTDNAKAGEYYSAIDDKDLVADELIADHGNKGYITTVEGDVLALTTAKLVDDAGETVTPSATELYTVTNNTKYFYIDGENTKSITAEDVTTQAVGSYKTGDAPFKAIVVDEDDNGVAEIVIVYK